MKKQENKAYKTDWDFKIFYKNDSDPQIEKDIQISEKAYITFEKKWKKDNSYTNDLDKLFKALTEYEKLEGLVETSKPITYFNFIKDINANNKKAISELSKIQERLTKSVNKILFFNLELGKISKDFQKQILKSEKLKHFHYFLELVWKTSKYDLSESEEKILNLMNDPASGMWKKGVNKVLSNQMIEHEGKDIPIAEAQGKILELPTQERKDLHQKINKAFMSVSSFAESEINAIYLGKKIKDELRGFKKPYEETMLRYQNDEKTLNNLVDVVTKNFKIAHRFYNLKSKLIGEDRMDYSARGISMGKIKKEFSFDDAYKILSSAFEKVDKKYVDMFQTFIKNGQVDVYPKVGKTGGAYCSSSIGIPTLVLHNYTNSYNSLNTLAHEMGHAFHAELSKKQRPLYQDHTISVAETASTLFENFAFDEVFETLSDDEKIIALHDKINSSISTIFRQIACFNFEKELHELVRSKGFVSKEEISETMNKHMKSYLGPKFDLKIEDGYFFVNWSHIRRFFYVYAYAYGELISTALYAEYKKDKKFISKIEQFLSAGGSKSPYQIFKDIGIDTTKPDFFLNGLKKIEEEIDVLEKLVKRK